MENVSSKSYRPDIDGLRAVAVLPVLLFHAKLCCPGGFVGVDIFFVISGFLISTLILRELRDGTFSLVGFWERRIRRILPALAVVVLITLVAGWFLYLPANFECLGKSVIAQATLLSNVYFYRQGLLGGGYFATTWFARPLMHTWSLAVEEQFYVLFPLFLIIPRRYRKLSLGTTLGGIAIASFALSVVGSYLWPSATFYLLPTRAWELLLGALLALTGGRRPASEAVKETTGWLGVSLIGYAVFFYGEDTRFPGLAAVPPCLGAALIIFSSESKPSLVGRLLSCKPVVFVGLISYSLYLWHWPVLEFSRYPYSFYRSWHRLALLAMSTALAILSWKYVETPFRKRRVFQGRRQIFAFAGSSIAIFLIFGFLVLHGQGIPSRFSARALSYIETRSHNPSWNNISLQEAQAGQFVELGSKEGNQPIDILIWGDSHAMAVTPAIDELCRRFSCRGMQATYVSTAPVLDYVSTGPYSLKEKSPAFNKAVFNFISQRHVKNVIIAAYWSWYPKSDSFKTGLLSTVRTVMNLGTRVYVLKDVPTQANDLANLTALAALHDYSLEALGVTPDKHRLANDDFATVFDQISQMGATVLDPADYFLNHSGLYGVVRNDQILYWDSHHLTVEGSKLLVPLFEPILHSK